MQLSVEAHPSLDLVAFLTIFPAPIGESPSPDWLKGLLSLEAEAPVSRSEELRAAVRDLLRYGGYKPTGRSKPASEYLVRAAGQGALGRINLPVDTCNVVSLHSGLPISVIDVDRASEPFRVGLARADDHYVFNAGGQEIKVGGLLCLHDGAGPCANAVKDAQRTKTYDGTRRTLSLVWGTRAFEGYASRAADWYRELLTRAGAQSAAVFP